MKFYKDLIFTSEVSKDGTERNELLLLVDEIININMRQICWSSSSWFQSDAQMIKLIYLHFNNTFIVIIIQMVLILINWTVG